MDEEEDFNAAFGPDDAPEAKDEPKRPEPEAPEPKDAADKPPEPPAETQPAPDAPTQRDPGVVPIKAVLEERDKRQKAEAEITRLRARYEQPTPVEPNQAPDIFEDQQGYEDHQRAQIGQALFFQRHELSRAVAEVKHGADTVTAVHEWAAQRCGEDPYFNQRFYDAPMPYEMAVTEYQREQIASQVTPSDFAAFKAWQAAQAGTPSSADSAPAAPPARPVLPQRSLASARSVQAGAADEPEDEQAEFRAAFRKG